MMNTGCTIVQSPFGPVRIDYEGDAVTSLRWVPDAGTAVAAADPVAETVRRQLEEYFAGMRRSFSFSIALRGTTFQRRVWSALRDIPYGETRTYGEIAAQIGAPAAARAVGMANHRNPLPIIVPCHRVVGADGKLTGYAWGLEIKWALLELERAHR